MIKLTWGNLNDGEFMRALETLLVQKMGFDFAQKSQLLGKTVKKQIQEKVKVHETLLKEHGTADKEKPGFYSIPEENRAKYAEDMEKLNKHEFTVRINKMDAKELSKKIDFSPQDLMLLEPIFTGLLDESGASTDDAKETGPETKQPPQAGLKAVPPEQTPAH